MGIFIPKPTMILLNGGIAKFLNGKRYRKILENTQECEESKLKKRDDLKTYKFFGDFRKSAVKQRWCRRRDLNSHSITTTRF
jgi:hypothetical protein